MNSFQLGSSTWRKDSLKCLSELRFWCPCSLFNVVYSMQQFVYNIVTLYRKRQDKLVATLIIPSRLCCTLITFCKQVIRSTQLPNSLLVGLLQLVLNVLNNIYLGNWNKEYFYVSYLFITVHLSTLCFDFWTVKVSGYWNPFWQKQERHNMLV